MISIIIKSYFFILLSVGVGSIIIFCLGLYFIFRKSASKSNKIKPLNAIKGETDGFALSNLSAIAGEDIFTTQLDLARAFIEAHKTDSAKNILSSIITQGNAKQKQAAQQLLNNIH